MVRLPGYPRFNPYAFLDRKKVLFAMQPLYMGLDIDHKKIETSFNDQAGNLVSGPFCVLILINITLLNHCISIVLRPKYRPPRFSFLFHQTIVL